MMKLFKWIEKTSENIRNSIRVEESRTYRCSNTKYGNRYRNHKSCNNKINKLNAKVEELEGLIHDNYDE